MNARSKDFRSVQLLNMDYQSFTKRRTISNLYLVQAV
jgi:hypothetical protein